MLKKRRRRRPQPARTRAPSHVEPDSPPHAHLGAPPPVPEGLGRCGIDALLDEFMLCRLAVLCPDHAALEAEHVEPLLVLATADGEDPISLRWAEERIRHLLLDLLPRHVWYPREMLLEQIPALGAFFAFLHAHGYWHADSMEVDSAQRLLDELVLPVLEIVEDPSHRSGPENVHAFATSLGYRMDDPTERTVFTAWFNTLLTTEERFEVIDSGRWEGWPRADG